MCFGGGSSGRTVEYQAADPVTIAPPTTTVELDESDVDTAAGTDDSTKTGRQTLRNDLTTSNIGSSIAGQGINILGGTNTATKKVKK